MGGHPETMPDNLHEAHDTLEESLRERNDEVLEHIYIGRRFKNDTERLEKLFELYTKMTSQPHRKSLPHAKSSHNTSENPFTPLKP